MCSYNGSNTNSLDFFAATSLSSIEAGDNGGVIGMSSLSVQISHEGACCLSSCAQVHSAVESATNHSCRVFQLTSGVHRHIQQQPDALDISRCPRLASYMASWHVG
jgi:hypothetical protein